MNPHEWVDAPEAVPRAAEATNINIYLPNKLVDLLKEFASRNNISYQVLIKRWLDDRIKIEFGNLKINKNLKQLAQNILDAAVNGCQNIDCLKTGRICGFCNTEIQKDAEHLLELLNEVQSHN